MNKHFFTSGDMLAMTFTGKRMLSQQQDKWFKDGYKAMEWFQRDIATDLLQWAVEGDTIYYKTTKHWYMFSKKGEHIIEMAQFTHGTTLRKDTWMNQGSVSVGKKFLVKYNDKRVKLFKEG